MPDPVFDADTLAARLDRFPRLSLASYPTPLEPLEHLTAQLRGPRLWVKRDDAIGPGMGGNKARKLEYLMADAQRRGAIRIVTFGGLQSNHARMTAAVARQLGMEPHLFFFERRPRVLAGNLLLDDLLDTRMHFLPLGGSGGMTLEQTNRLVRILSLVRVGPSYFIPVGGHTALGCLGYVSAAIEIEKQVQSRRLDNVTLVTAVGTGGTLAGLVAGFHLMGSSVRVLGIDVGKLWRAFPVSIARLCTAICQLLDAPSSFAAANIPLVENRYVGVAYGTPSSAGNAAICRVAAGEGIFLDPVYTGKAMAGMLDLIQQGYFPGDANVVFLHTGGIPGLFAFPEIDNSSRQPYI